jgi:hypothetical protein
MIDLAYHLSAQFPFKQFGRLRERKASPNDHPNYRIFQSMCRSTISARKRDFGIKNAVAIRVHALILSEFNGDGYNSRVIAARDNIKITAPDAPLVPKTGTTTFRTAGFVHNR